MGSTNICEIKLTKSLTFFSLSLSRKCNQTCKCFLNTFVRSIFKTTKSTKTPILFITILYTLNYLIYTGGHFTSIITFKNRLLNSLVVECWHRVQEDRGYNSQSRTASYQRRYKNNTSSSLVLNTQHWKWKYWLFLKN